MPGYKGFTLRSIFILALFYIFAGSSFCEEVKLEIQPRALTLKESIDIAVINNKKIQIQEEEVSYARANILDAKSAFLPQLDASYGYKLNDAIPAVIGPANSRKDLQIFTGFKNDNTVSFAVTESVYNGGANIANLKQARLGLKVQEETLRQAKLDMEFEAKRLYYGLLLAYETKRIAQDLVAQAQAHYEEVRSKFGQGTASKFDVLQSKVQVSRLIPQLVNAENSIGLIMVEFKKLLGINMTEDIRIDGALSYTARNLDESEFLKEAYSHSPQMILKLLGIDVQRWAIEYARAGWLPQISADAGYNYRSNNISDMMNPRHDNWYVGARASIAVFDGFSTKAKVDEARARYSQALISKDDVADQLIVDITSGCLNAREAQSVIDAEKDSIDEAKEALRLAGVRYDNGVGINLDVLDAQVALAQVEQSLAQGLYDYIMAKAQLDRTMGRMFVKED